MLSVRGEMKLRNSHIVIVLLMTLLSSCKAPHTNPLDPDNPDNVFCALKGKVQTEKIPRQPISGVEISWQNDNIVVQTNANGEYSLDKLNKIDGWLKFSKDGYQPDSQYIEWDGEKLISVNKFLNSVPKIESLYIYSKVINRHLLDPTITLIVETRISDQDKDVDTVFVVNSDLGISAILDEITLGYFKKEFSPSSLGIEYLDEIIGKELNIVVKDKNGMKFTIATSNLKRIIKEQITTKAPIENDTVSTKPRLEWRRFTPGFKFQYQLQVYTDDITRSLVWEKTGYSSDSIAVNVESQITGNPENEYYWVIWAIDEFNNKTQSTPASFIVEP